MLSRILTGLFVTVTSMISAASAALALFIGFFQIEQARQQLSLAQEQITASYNISKDEARLTILQYESETMREMFWKIKERFSSAFPTNFSDLEKEGGKGIDPKVVQDNLNNSFVMLTVFTMSSDLFTAEGKAKMLSPLNDVRVTSTKLVEIGKAQAPASELRTAVINFLRSLDMFVRELDLVVQDEINKRHKEMGLIKRELEASRLPKTAENKELFNRMVRMVRVINDELATALK